MGKSFLCRAMEKQIKRELNPFALTTPVIDKPYKRILPDTFRKLWRAGIFLMRNPTISWALLREVFRGRDSVRISRCKKFINLLSEFQRSYVADRSNSLMTEQGVLQAIWSLEMLADESVYERVMRRSTRWLPDAVILVEAELTQNRDQLERRKGGRSAFDRLHGEELSKAIERGNLKRHQILSLWAELVPDGHRLDFKNYPGRDTKFVFDWLVAHLR